MAAAAVHYSEICVDGGGLCLEEKLGQTAAIADRQSQMRFRVKWTVPGWLVHELMDLLLGLDCALFVLL